MPPSMIHTVDLSTLTTCLVSHAHFSATNFVSSV